MKLKSTSIFAGILTLALVAAPLTAQACSGNKERGTSETNVPDQTETSVTIEENNLSS
ncbi:hypothetical protein IQ255_29580 [Pleurocapsales cyanobacterium LEGE 10410]|nr:hypothetical protein [Pleurocapsales cyanobacterium LEGE 10410]